MTRITLDPQMRAKLNGLQEQLEVCDESGKTLGLFVPLELYKKLLYASLTIPFSEQEIERRQKETGGCSLEEFWQKMGRT